MGLLEVHFGPQARDELCEALRSAQKHVEAEFHDLADRDVIASINQAARRKVAVEIHIEGNRSRYGKQHASADRRDARAIATLRRELDPAVHGHPAGSIGAARPPRWTRARREGFAPVTASRPRSRPRPRAASSGRRP